MAGPGPVQVGAEDGARTDAVLIGAHDVASCGLDDRGPAP